jgi:hypothetical protein
VEFTLNLKASRVKADMPLSKQEKDLTLVLDLIDY